MKYCPKCETWKDESEYHPDKSRPSGLAGWCRKCKNACVAQWAAKNHAKVCEKSKRWRENNPERAKLQSAAWIAANHDKRKATAARAYKKAKDRLLPASRTRAREWYASNKERALSNSKAWGESNPERLLEMKRNHNRKFRSTPKGNLSSTVSKRMNESLRKGMKAGRHWESLVDFTIDQLKRHLEKLFKPGMTWENYGTAWHVDHKTPIAAFNFERPDDIDFRLCWSLKNLQPLEASKNISKGDKIDRPFQPSLAIGAR